MRPLASPAAGRAAIVLLLFAASAASGQSVGETVGEGIVRFYPSPEAAARAQPYPGLVKPLVATGAPPAGFPVVPKFESRMGRNVARIDVASGTDFYGTGEVTGPLRRNGLAVTLWNTDAYGYGDGTSPLYQSHPWVLAVRSDGSAFGVLFATTWRGYLDLSRGILFAADGPPFGVIVIDRPSPQEVVEALAGLTGRMPLPPRWALGYQQCRYSYVPDARVREVAETFREKRIPCDVIWLDIDYMWGFRSFTYDPARFPDPAGLNAFLHDRGFHSVWMLDPGIKRDPGYRQYESGTRDSVWVRTVDGRAYTGSVWPGPCVFPDFLNAAARAWWGRQVEGFVATGVDGLWNDMNEPSVFNVSGKTMPPDNRHRADPALGGPGPHARYHNVYGMEMARASREGLLAARPTRRPFVLTRASHLGGQRYAATWTGDNASDWPHLAASVPMALNLGLSGQPFSGPDIGGFAGSPSGPLFARWMGIGALLPFARDHTEKGSDDQEPWAFGPQVEATCRRALERRYRLLPYLYTVFHEAAETGLPVARPLFFADPADPALRRVETSFLLGGDVLVAARVAREGSPSTVRPGGAWRRFGFGAEDLGDRELPELYLRGGAIVAAGPVLQHVTEAPADTLTLLAALDANGRAEGTLYEDAGDGFGYREGEYRVIRYTARTDGDSVRVAAAVVQGNWALPPRILRIRLLTPAGEVGAAGPNRRPLALPLTR